MEDTITYTGICGLLGIPLFFVFTDYTGFKLSDKSGSYTDDLKDRVVSTFLDGLVYLGLGNTPVTSGFEILKVISHSDENISTRIYPKVKLLPDSNEANYILTDTTLNLTGNCPIDIEIDIEYNYKGVNYKLIAQKGLTVELPEYLNSDDMILPKMTFISGFISNKVEETEEESEVEKTEVTDELIQYLGPKGDFHNKEVTPELLFPYFPATDTEPWVLQMNFIKRGKERTFTFEGKTVIEFSDKISDTLSTISSDSTLDITHTI